MMGATSIIITAMLGLSSQLAAAAPTAGHDLTAPLTARDEGGLERRLAPVVTWSNDKQSTASVQCTTDKTYQNIFLYTSDVTKNAKNICDAVFKEVGPTMPAVGHPEIRQGYKIKGHDMIALTIWHKGHVNAMVGVTNLGMPTTADARNKAYELCLETISLETNQCQDSVHNSDSKDHDVARDGTITWTSFVAENSPMNKALVEFTFQQEED